MKKLFSVSLFICVLLMLSGKAMSQITVSGSTGADGSYTDLTGASGAFFALNNNAQSGNTITISITADVLTEPGTISLNANGWASLTISPSGGASRTVSGSFIGPLINLNGADNVIFDGLNSGGNSLTISNSARGASSTIKFIADASNNTITNCTILGSDSLTANGVIFFSTGTSTGNDGNSITNCNIGPAGSNLPLNGIFSLGTSSLIDNSGNTVSGNNIYDYFTSTLTASNASAGINLANTGNSGWTITNNKLYQTSNRIVTVANITLNAIVVASGSGYTISGNTIGYSNSAGAGTTNYAGITTGTITGTFPSSYSLAGVTLNALRYIGINCAFTVNGAVSSIQGNTIAGFALLTSSGASSSNGILCGINVTSGNANIGTTTGNTIGSTSGTGSIYAAMSTGGGTIVGIFAQSSNTINIQNNSVGALDAMGTTSSLSGAIIGIGTSSSGSFNLTANTIGNTTNPNLRMGNLTSGGNLSNTGTFSTATGNGAFRGMNIGSSGGTNTIGTVALPNIIRNASVNTTGAGATFRGIENTSSSGVIAITGNLINNLTTASPNTSLSGAGMTGLGILISGGATGTVVTQNTIDSLSLTNTGTNGTNVAGIGIASATNINVSRNIIFDLSNASTSTVATTPGTASGIFIRSGTTSTNIFNNMITLGNGQTTNTSFFGIWGNHGQLNNPVTNIYYNSVYITGTVSSGAQPSFGYLRGDLSATARNITVDIRNNIFNNDRTGGTGKHYAIANNYGATASTTGWFANASNFNVLNSASSSTVGYWNADQSFASWKTTASSDLLSISGVPITFANFAAGDLHINMGLTPTQLESAGTVITGYTTDIDAQTRPGPAGSVNGGALNPDLGADEFDGVPLDLTPPAITYIPLLGTSCLTTRDLTATIFDGLGLNTNPGTKPRIYFRKTTNANTIPATNDNTTDGWKFAEASNSSSPFNFTMNYSSLFGGIASGDVVEYFVVAQDTAPTPNVGVNTATFSIQPTSVALTAANAPITGANSYSMLTGLSGTVTIGASGTYPTLTGPGGLFAAINTNGLSGSLIAEILDPSIAETGANPLNALQYGCTPNSQLTIRPASGVTTVLSGSNAAALIDFNSADYVTIDGSNNGSSSKDMTIRNTGTGASIRFINGATFDTIKSCIIESQNTSTNGGSVFFSTSNAVTGNNNNVISGCDIRDRSDAAGVPAIGVYSEGSVPQLNTANKITGCNIFNFTSSAVTVSLNGAGDGWTIDANSIYQVNNVTLVQRFISVKGGNAHFITNNFIGGRAANAGGAFLSTSASLTCIDLTLGAGAATTISGNTIMNIRSTVTLALFSSNAGNLDITGNTFGSADTSKRVDFGPSSVAVQHTGSNSVVNFSSNTLINLSMPTIAAGAGFVALDFSPSTGGSCSVINNTVTNITCNGNSNSLFSSSTTAMNIFVKGVNTIRGNIITNIGNINTAAASSFSKSVYGLTVVGSLAGTVIEKNKISNLYGSTTTGALADNILGFLSQLSANFTFSNNTISLDGGSNPSNRVIYGINETSSATATTNYYYNSVSITGANNSANNTYAFIRSQSQTIVNLRNNVFSNTRTSSSTGINFAIANEIATPNTQVGWSNTASNYNALYTANSSAACRWGNTGSMDLATFQSNSGGDAYTVFGDPGFTSATNLLPDGSNVNCWTLKGNGIALSSINSDILGNPRSTTIAGGGTDIGAYEFIASVPPPVYNNATPSTGTYKYIHAQDTMATVNVTSLGTLADVNVQYFSGDNPPGLEGDPTIIDGYGNVYWEVHPTNPATGFSYDITLHYSPALLGSIINESQIKVAKNTNVDTQYVPFTVQGIGPGEYQLDTAKNNITVYGLTAFSRFTLTDASTPLPVELASFTSAINGRNVCLNWTTSSEQNNSGFDIERKSGDGSWTKIGNVKGNGTTHNTINYSYTDKNLTSGKYEFRLKQIDYNGNSTYYNLSSEVVIGIPVKFELSQNYPNPFNPTTKINYAIPVDGKVSMILYDISGREISSLVNEVKTAGYYTINLNASNLASGTYFYRITAEGGNQKFVETKKMVVLK